jgi:hypothetical protein
MENKVQTLLNECIGIICELPAHNPVLVKEATSGKIDPEFPGQESVAHAKALIPTLRWLLGPEATKKTAKRGRPPKSAKEGEAQGAATAQASGGNGGQKVQKKRGRPPTKTVPVEAPVTSAPPTQDELPV